jgi:hypothetical protein
MTDEDVEGYFLMHYDHYKERIASGKAEADLKFIVSQNEQLLTQLKSLRYSMDRVSTGMDKLQAGAGDDLHHLRSSVDSIKGAVFATCAILLVSWFWPYLRTWL